MINLAIQRDMAGRSTRIALICVCAVLSLKMPLRSDEPAHLDQIWSTESSAETGLETSSISDIDNIKLFDINQVMTGHVAESPPELANRVADWRSDGKALFHLRGRIDADLIEADQSAANKAIFGDLPNAGGLRRARLGGQGYFTPDVRYVAEIDMASGDLVIRDLLVGWGDVRDQGEIRGGHLREPFSLEGGTSANSYAFLERSPTNTFDPARNWGLGYFKCSSAEMSTLAMGVFHSGKGPNDLRGGEASNNAVTTKWTALPWYEESGTQLMHVGIALSSRFPEHGLVVINQNPRSPLLEFSDSTTSPFVPTIRIPANFQELFNAQWAFVDGPFSIQAEWYGNLVDQKGGKPVFYHGSYVNLSYFLTGETRAYQTQNGVFGAVAVAQPFVRGFSSEKSDLRMRGYGAWELTTQLGYTDTFDPNTPPGPLGQSVGVKLPEVTIGVNWYLADRLRIMFNYSHVAPNEPTIGSSSANILSSRLAMFW